MSTFARVLAAMVVVAFLAGPVSAAAATNAPTLVAQATSATISGTVVDDGGAPIAGAKVELRGPSTYTTTTDANGAFSIADVATGFYVLAASKPGFDSASESDFTVFAGEPQKVTIALHHATLTALRTIATVRTTGRGQFNTTPASVDVVTAQNFLDQAEPQVGRVLNQIPGVQNTLPTSSANGNVAGAITVPNIRGALSNETASLIDGHPLAVGDYGDYVTTFLNSFMLGSVEVIKGPGAMSPQTNYAIGGTVNFRTKDPTLTETPDYTFGFTNHGGTYYNLGISDTISNGKLGFVFDVAGIDDPSALNGYQSYFQVYGNNSVANWNGVSGQTTSYNPSYTSTYAGGTNSKLNNVYSLVACCYTYNGDFNNISELVKVRYKFSGSTTATVSYLGSQTWADQNANTSELIPSTFNPGAAAFGFSAGTLASYTGSLASGTALNIPNSVYPQTAQEINNEPIFQAEVSTTLDNDTILARFYHASIDRLIYEGAANPSSPIVGTYSLYGINPAPSSSCKATTCPPLVFNGQPTNVAFFDWYNQFEEDRLTGLSFQYTHPFGDGDNVAFSVENTQSSSTAGSQSAGYPGVVFGTNNYAPPGSPTQSPSVSNPQGTTQTFTTLLLRTNYNFSPKLNGLLSLYDNLYQNTFPYACLSGTGAIGSPCAINGSNAEFTTNHTSHFDERMALEYRPKNNIAVRFSAGSAISPPYLSLLSKVDTTPSCRSGICTFNQNNPNLVPETAFGYDLGADYRFKDNATVLSVDGYLTNLYNHFLAESVSYGTCATSSVACPAGSPAADLVYGALNTNLNNSRFEGIELSLRRTVAEGIGYNLSGAVQHAYAYNLPTNFYCQNLAVGQTCTPANYNVNLPIIAGQNFTGNTFGTVYNLAGTASVGASGFSNTAIPYFQGYGELNYTFKSGMYAAIGDTVYGKNNGYNLPPFGVVHATIRVPLNKTLTAQISGDNIFNAWPGLFPIVGGGIAYPLANGTTGATIGNTVGPASYHFELTKTFGATSSDYKNP